MKKHKGLILGILVIISLALLMTNFFSGSVIAQPFGANVTEEDAPERGSADAATSWEAYAGNVTGISLTGESITQSWQGFHGNVTGVITLENSAGDVFYNWTDSDPQGEVFASTNQSITWGNIQCFNFTANGTHIDVGSETAGGTNLYGTNVTQLETEFGIGFNDMDGVNETFGTTITHDAFTVNSLAFSAGECLATAPFDSTGESVDGQFEEVLLYEPATFSTVFAALLEQDESGFDSATHDFEMLVLEDGHGADTSTTSYYFFIELG